jgi:hypothetical protein
MGILAPSGIYACCDDVSLASHNQIIMAKPKKTENNHQRRQLLDRENC